MDPPRALPQPPQAGQRPPHGNIRDRIAPKHPQPPRSTHISAAPTPTRTRQQPQQPTSPPKPHDELDPNPTLVRFGPTLLVSPALADLSGLPPLLIIAGGAESLLSCAERIAANARRDGIDARQTVYPDKAHGWMILSKLPATIQASDEIDHWISETLGVSR